ncbi:hypothetical protein HYH02_006890 [Chlamydomonas schloesseri]|uniref:Uncharacterized protein n=1 Tax=Chlamydomonas schloesseri TaxID=2026947 RepID=A0A835WJM6_9CHLO|nr:hypothetical protein HYH02_006890 [Chlamydomonas schloesseri]|eukprot:KAG2448306.1 hypothetical protein HYH02_006890 [Chlamydomonas schloesseri]
MEKLQQRPSAGGGKLGTLDMQSYLEVMGRQLAEIQAQHNQFYASRPERYSRAAAAAKEPRQERRVHRSSSAVSPSSAHKAEGHTPDTHAVGTPSSDESGLAGGSGGNARRSLVFEDGVTDVKDHGDKPAGRNAKSDGHSTLRTSLSSPPPVGGLSMDEEAAAAAVRAVPAANAAARPRRPPAGGAGQSLLAQAQVQSQAARVRARTPPRASPAGVSPRQHSASATGLSPSLSPSSVSASTRPGLSNPGTPSSVATSSHLASVAAGLTPRDGTPPASAHARAAADSSVESSPALGRGLGLGGGCGGDSFAMYNVEAGGISAVTGYDTTLESQTGPGAGQRAGGWQPHAAASVSASSVSTSQSRSAWATPQGAGASGAAAATPSSAVTSALTASAMSSALAVHNEPSGARVRAIGALGGVEDSVSEEEGLPHPLALAGMAFDGIDSEEEDEEEDAVARPEVPAAVSAAAQRGHEGRGGGRQPAASGEYGPAGLGAEGSGPASARASGLGAPSSSRAPVPVSGQPGARPALVAASLETEEALRALLSSPRQAAVSHVSGGMSSSLDGGVPEDVLAALAKTDAGGLDAALGAAVATLLRQHAASLGVHGPAGRPSTQGQGTGSFVASHASPGGASAAAAAGLRHAALMGPGALTAAPAALPPGVAGRGFDSSLRSAGGAPGASPGGCAAAANAGRGLALHAAAPPVDASISLDQIDQLACPMVIDADTAALMRASVVAAATAMAEQRAAAAAHQQPVLYSMGQTRVSDPGSSQAPPEPAAGGVTSAISRPGTGARGPLSPSAASSVGKPGGGGDSVLYGSPDRRGGGAVAAPPVDGHAPPSIVPSPYVPPSPPPGADPSPYMTSPIGHPISRLQHSSRQQEEEEEELVAAVKAKPATNRPAGGSDDGGAVPASLTVSVGAAVAAAAAARGSAGHASTPTGAPDGLHRRQSNISGAASYDLSLTAAAAVGASRSGSTSAARAAGPASSRAAPSSHAATPTGAGASVPQGQPVFSSFSLAGLSPTSARAAPANAQSSRGIAQMSSFDLGIDEAGKPSPPGPAGAGDSAVNASAARVSAHAQPPAAGPPLAAFSRAAAMAAAADVGLLAPPPVTERRPSQGGATPAGGQSSASMEAAARASAAGAGAGASREPIAPDQNAVGGSSVASSAAKLSQLKARRQQQWQSQHGVNASAADGQQPRATPQPTGANAARASASNHSAAAAGTGASPNNTPHAPANSRNRVSAEPGSAAAAARGSAGSHAPALAAPGPHPSPTALLPEEVANAIVRAASSGAGASGELNLGHGISGLSVAIEAGAVKWAWQTGLKDGGASPDASQASPWASPGGGQAVAAAALGTAGAGASSKPGGESGDWGVQLPTPQWQRRGATAPGSRQAAVDGADGADTDLARMEQEALQQRQQQWEAAQQQWEAELPGPQYRTPAGASTAGASAQQQQRRHTEHSGMAMQEGATAAHPTREYATSTGGGAGLPPAGLSADAAGAASSKAAALLRLKRQSIMRHGLAGSQARDGEQECEPESEASVAASMQGANPQRSSRAVSAPTHRASQRAQVPDGAPRVAYSRAWEQPQPVPEGDETGSGEDGGGNQGPAPKPFLRRRSAKVQPKKVDWTHVKPRTNSRNPDYYGDQQDAYGAQYVPQYAQQYAAQLLQQKHVQHQQRISPRGGGPAGGNADMQAILRPQHQQRSPMTSPRGGAGGAAKPPLNVNVGSRAWKPSGKSPTEDDRSAAAGRRRSNIPPVPVGANADGGLLVGAGGVSAARAGSAGGGQRGPPGATPLDDLLQHVNTLLKDFDKMVR